MSHVVDAKPAGWTSKAIIAKAAAACGLYVVEKTTYKWYGTHIGDYPLPEGFTKADMGRCDFALKVKGSSTAYEAGIVKRRDGKPGFTILYDFFGTQGRALQDKIGVSAQKLKQAYALEAAKAKFAQDERLAGFTLSHQVLKDGTVRTTGVKA